LNDETSTHQFANSPLHQLQRALESRHLANLTGPEVARALRALSSCYVERRAKLASGAPLATPGKRAAFALYYGPLHFVIVSEIVRARGPAARTIRSIHDLGCGTGVAGVAWALQCAVPPFVGGVDRSAWAVDEANWLYREMKIRGRASKSDLSRGRYPARHGRIDAEEAILFAYTLNELNSATRSDLLRGVIPAVDAGATLLIIEPIAKRLGNSGWWEEWRTALEPHGVSEQEWRFPATRLPEPTRSLARAAGLDPYELTARTLSTLPVRPAIAAT
jgi:hypothetical protein